MCTVWHVDKYKITFKLVINYRRISCGPAWYNWCQGPVPGRGPAVGKYCSRCLLGKLYLVPQPDVWMCFLCTIEELVLMQVMLTVVPPSLLCSGYRISFPEAKRPGHGVDNPPCLAPRLKKSRAIPLLPLWAFVACSRVNCTSTFIVPYSWCWIIY